MGACVSPTRVTAPEVPALTAALVSPPYFLCAAAGRGSLPAASQAVGDGTDWRCPSAVLQLLLPSSPFPAPLDSGRCGAGALNGPTRALLITSVTQLWDKGSLPSHVAPPRAACIRGGWIQVPRGHSPFSYCLFLPPFFFFLRSFSLLGTKHPAASGPKPRLGLKQAGHVLPHGPLGRWGFSASVM